MKAKAKAKVAPKTKTKRARTVTETLNLDESEPPRKLTRHQQRKLEHDRLFFEGAHNASGPSSDIDSENDLDYQPSLKSRRLSSASDCLDDDFGAVDELDFGENIVGDCMDICEEPLQELVASEGSGTATNLTTQCVIPNLRMESEIESEIGLGPNHPNAGSALIHPVDPNSKVDENAPEIQNLQTETHADESSLGVISPEKVTETTLQTKKQLKFAITPDDFRCWHKSETCPKLRLPTVADVLRQTESPTLSKNPASRFLQIFYPQIDTLLHHFTVHLPKGNLVKLWEARSTYCGLGDQDCFLVDILSKMSHCAMDALKQGYDITKLPL